jgi:hypothetical protein
MKRELHEGTFSNTNATSWDQVEERLRKLTAESIRRLFAKPVTFSALDSAFNELARACARAHMAYIPVAPEFARVNTAEIRRSIDLETWPMVYGGSGPVPVYNPPSQPMPPAMPPNAAKLLDPEPSKHSGPTTTETLCCENRTLKPRSGALGMGSGCWCTQCGRTYVQSVAEVEGGALAKRVTFDEPKRPGRVAVSAGAVLRAATVEFGVTLQALALAVGVTTKPDMTDDDVRHEIASQIGFISNVWCATGHLLFVVANSYIDTLDALGDALGVPPRGIESIKTYRARVASAIAGVSP